MRLIIVLIAVLTLSTGRTRSLLSQPSVRTSSSVAAIRGSPTSALPDLRKVRSIDGIDVARYNRFWNDWKLVTVRYRKDNGEQRFIYANPVAWKAMKKGGGSYPDNAMFAKVAFAVTEDAAFPNSVEPRGVTRVQLMRKDAAAYKGTNGWGYALIAGGVAARSSDREVAGACHACHKLVPERDFVFSSSSFLPAAPGRATSADFRARFHDQPVGSLTAFEKRSLSHVLRNEPVQSLVSIRSATMNLFEGSVNESVGVISHYATEAGKVYALWDAQHEQFAIARPLPPSAECKSRSWIAISVGSTQRSGPGNLRERIGIMCNGVWQQQKHLGAIPP